MAISGCDFVCKNNDCKHKGSGIVITSAWPLGDIDKVINSRKIAQNTVFKKELEDLKSKDRKFACISLPDSENIPVVGYRIHMWCEKCPCLWNYDAMILNPAITEPNAIIEDAVKNANIPENCPTCNTKLKTFSELIEKDSEGIKCTSCQTKLQHNVWFCNEIGTSDKLNPLIKLPNKE